MKKRGHPSWWCPKKHMDFLNTRDSSNDEGSGILSTRRWALLCFSWELIFLRNRFQCWIQVNQYSPFTYMQHFKIWSTKFFSSSCLWQEPQIAQIAYHCLLQERNYPMRSSPQDRAEILLQWNGKDQKVQKSAVHAEQYNWIKILHGSSVRENKFEIDSS